MFDRRTKAATREEWQWGPALGAGFLAAAILLVVPRGSPWSSFTFFTPTIMGRGLPPEMNIALPVAWCLHLGLGLIYGLIITWVVKGLHQHRAILVGGALGLLLYLASAGVVAAFWPEWRNNQVPVLFAHLVFGLLCAGAYRGLLRKPSVPT